MYEEETFVFLLLTEHGLLWPIETSVSCFFCLAASCPVVTGPPFSSKFLSHGFFEEWGRGRYPTPFFFHRPQRGTLFLPQPPKKKPVPFPGAFSQYPARLLFVPTFLLPVIRRRSQMLKRAKGHLGGFPFADFFSFFPFPPCCFYVAAFGFSSPFLTVALRRFKFHLSASCAVLLHLLPKYCSFARLQSHWTNMSLPGHVDAQQFYPPPSRTL